MAKRYQPITVHELVRGLQELEEAGELGGRRSTDLLNEVITNTYKMYAAEKSGKKIQPVNAKLTKEQAIKETQLYRNKHKPNSQVLRENMLAAGRAVPKGTDAHHIVPDDENRVWAKKYADAARAILNRWGIDINHEANGVALPNSEFKPHRNSKYRKQFPNVYSHKKVHTKVYYLNVADQLGYAKSREETIRILRDIGERLEDGEFPIE